MAEVEEELELLKSRKLDLGVAMVRMDLRVMLSPTSFLHHRQREQHRGS